MNEAYLILGGNLGDRRANLENAISQLEQKGVVLLCKSSIYKTAAWGNEDQPDYYNQVIKVATHLDAIYLLRLCLEVEAILGRIRKEKWGERTMDIDILYFNDKVMNSDELKLPHPRIEERRFVLVPLVEIAPDFIHPKKKSSNSELLELCNDNLSVEIVE